MTSYQDLGIRKIINAFATVTIYGGSIMAPEVVQAMTDAAGSFVDLKALHRKITERIAELTQNEDAYVTSGAAAGILLSAAACVMHKTPDDLFSFPNIDHMKNEVILFGSHANGYDFGLRQIGTRVIEIEHSRDALNEAITGKTSSIFWFLGTMNQATDMPLAEVIEIANQHQVPVIVDAAAQLPPVENLWNFTQMGASLAIFSGGKDLRGPQASGLILGRHDLIEIIRRLSNPNQGLGRSLKVGKEELMGTLAAVERYLAMDHAGRAAYCESTVKLWCEGLNALDGVTATRDYPNEAGQPLAWCLLTVDQAVVGKTAPEIVQALLDGDPAIAVAPMNETQFHLNPMTLEAGEEQIVLERCLALLG